MSGMVDLDMEGIIMGEYGIWHGYGASHSTGVSRYTQTGSMYRVG